ncbi:MAG: hypothetical protein JXA09_05885, partial [Anaerolineae bacterium]|nr:hypothetical protein [Anaerolineae bacterium]
MSEVTQDRRSLLVVSYLAELAVPELRWLYRWIEDNAVDVARMLSHRHYGAFSALEGDDATYASFLGRLDVLGSDPQVQAIDVFLHVHGSPGALAFKGGDKRAADIERDLVQLGLRHKLR